MGANAAGANAAGADAEAQQLLALRALLALNAGWDACAFAWMCIVGARDAPLVPPHWALWAHADDVANPAARSLFAALVLQWGLTRLLVVCGQAHWSVAAALYGLEGVFMLVCIAGGLMRPARAGATAALSLLCLVAVLLLGLL